MPSGIERKGCYLQAIVAHLKSLVRKVAVMTAFADLKRKKILQMDDEKGRVVVPGVLVASTPVEDGGVDPSESYIPHCG